MNDSPRMQSEAELDMVGDALGVLWRRRRLLLVAVIVTTVLAILTALFATPMYRAETVLIPNESRAQTEGLAGSLGSLAGLASLAGVQLGSADASTEEALAVLRSREFTERFVEREGIRQELFSGFLDRIIRNRWRSEEARTPTLAEAARRFDRRVRTIVQDRRTGLLRLQIDWKDPARAAAWANGLVGMLNEEMRERAGTQAARNLKFLETEMARTATVSTREALSNLIESNVRDRMMATVTPDYAFRVIDTAMVPDRKDPVFPKKGLLVGLGPLAGLFLGILIALLIEAFARRTRGS